MRRVAVCCVVGSPAVPGPCLPRMHGVDEHCGSKANLDDACLTTYLASLKLLDKPGDLGRYIRRCVGLGAVHAVLACVTCLPAFVLVTTWSC